jgi:hypothetical protein
MKNVQLKMENIFTLSPHHPFTLSPHHLVSFLSPTSFVFQNSALQMSLRVFIVRLCWQLSKLDAVRFVALNAPQNRVPSKKTDKESIESDE